MQFSCICVDSDPDSRRHIEILVKKIKWLKLVSACATLNTALNICKKKKVDLVFICLHVVPVPEEKKIAIGEINKQQIKIITISSKMQITGNLIDLCPNFLMTPISTRRLQRAAMQALHIKDFAA